MIILHEMLVGAAEKAGIKVPKNPKRYWRKKYPHWRVFTAIQLGKPVRYHGEHWENAKIVASIPEDKVLNVTFKELADLGASL